MGNHGWGFSARGGTARFPGEGYFRTKVILNKYAGSSSQQQRPQASDEAKGTLSIVVRNARDSVSQTEYKTLRAEYRPASGIYFSIPQQLAVMQGQHSRLGEHSLLRQLDPQLLSNHVLRVPQKSNTNDAELFRSFLQDFWESEEMRIDELFASGGTEDDFSFYHEEKSLWFYTLDLDAALRLLKQHFLPSHIALEETDPHTGEKSLTLYADPEEEHEIVIHLDPKDGLVLVTGLGVEYDDKDSHGTFHQEAGSFKYFVQKLKDKILADAAAASDEEPEL